MDNNYKKGEDIINEIKVLSLFSGIGAFEKGLERLNIPYELVGFSEIDKYAITSYCAIHNVNKDKNLGDISEVDIKDIPDCDLVTYGFPCSPKGQLVITKEGYKPVEEIKETDLVLTHKNRYKKVVKTMSRISQDLYKFKGLGFPELYLTEEHPIYIIRKGENNNQPFWCKTKDIKKGDYISINVNNKQINRYDLTEEECWLLGRYLADGYVKYAPDCKYIVFCIGNKKSDEFERHSIKYAMTNIRKPTDSCFEYTCFDKKLIKLSELIGVGSNVKTIPEFIINLPNDLLEIFLNGYLSGDGFYDTKTNRQMYSTTSKKVSLGLQRIYIKLYEKSPSIYLRKDNRKKTFSDSYNGQIRHHVIPKDTFILDDKFYSKIKEIEYISDYNDYVYNFEVQDDNSYTLENIIVHNCQDISIAGRQKGIIHGETRSGLLYEALRIIEGKKPKCAIAENVKNLVGKKFKDDFDSLLEELDELGYNSYWKVLNAKSYGIPQNRERVFIVSIRKDIDDGTFDFPKGFDSGLRLKDILEDEVEKKYYINNERINRLLEELKEKRYTKMSVENINPSGRGLNGNVYNSQDISPTLTTDKGEGIKIICAERGRYNDEGKVEQQLEIKKDDNINTITTVQKDNLILEPIICEQRTDEGLRFFKNNVCGTIRTIDAGGDKRVIEKTNELQLFTNLSGGKWDKIHESARRVYDDTGISPTIPTCGGGNIEPKVQTDYKIRKLTPKECWRLMGFDDEDYLKARQALEKEYYNGRDRSNSQMYKQAGNSIVVDVLVYIYKNLFKGYL